MYSVNTRLRLSIVFSINITPAAVKKIHYTKYCCTLRFKNNGYNN